MEKFIKPELDQSVHVPQQFGKFIVEQNLNLVLGRSVDLNLLGDGVERESGGPVVSATQASRLRLICAAFRFKAAEHENDMCHFEVTERVGGREAGPFT